MQLIHQKILIHLTDWYHFRIVRSFLIQLHEILDQLTPLPLSIFCLDQREEDRLREVWLAGEIWRTSDGSQNGQNFGEDDCETQKARSSSHRADMHVDILN